MMNFNNLIDKHSEEITIYSKGSEGYYDHDNGGKLVKPPPKEETVQAAVFQMGIKDLGGSKLQFGEGGAYSIGDIKVYIHKELNKGDKIKWKNKEFTVHAAFDYTSHSKDLYIYLCKSGDVK